MIPYKKYYSKCNNAILNFFEIGNIAPASTLIDAHTNTKLHCVNKIKESLHKQFSFFLTIITHIGRGVETNFFWTH
jgi:hypothetical protein